MTEAAGDMAQLTIAQVALTYPRAGASEFQVAGEPVLIAWASFKIADGAGFELYIKSASLMYDERTASFFVRLPHEPRKAKCRGCGNRNADHAPFCNWCGARQECNERGYFYDVVVPANVTTRAAILDALVAEHKRHKL